MFSLVYESKIVKLIETESRMLIPVVVVGFGEGTGSMLAKGYEVSVMNTF